MSNTWLDGARDEVDLFLERNKLELAWDTLAEHAEDATLSEEGWRTLADAAMLMGLPDKAEDAQHRSRY